MENSSFKAGLPWMLAGAALAALAFVMLRPATPVQAQAPAAATPMNGAYQMSTWSAIDKNDNVFCGFFVMDTRSGMVINCDYNTVSNMTAKYGR